MNWERFRELYSKPSSGWWQYEYDGTWKVLEEEVRVGQGGPWHKELVQFTKVAEYVPSSWRENLHENQGDEAYMIVEYGTPSDTMEYWKITGWVSSYSGVHWNDNPTKVDKKTKTEVFYE